MRSISSGERALLPPPARAPVSAQRGPASSINSNYNSPKLLARSEDSTDVNSSHDSVRSRETPAPGETLRVSGVQILPVSSSELQCSVWPVGALHPVQVQLERLEAGIGCGAREGGVKETHVISAAKSSNTQVTVLLRPLKLSRPVNRPVILVLSSQNAVRWVVESEGLQHNINLLVQVSQNSSVVSVSVSMRLVRMSFLPRRPEVLLRWVLQRHTTISSLTHIIHANRVSLSLGEDPSMPSECLLQPRFMSQYYQASEFQEQEVHGCASSSEVAGTEVNVSVSLLPPVSHSGHHRVVLILSSDASVNWALVASEVKGHIRVYSSSSVSLYSECPDLTMSSTVTSDLLNIPDLLEWANQKNLSEVTSYTEADLANRFIIKLKGYERDAGADVSGSESWRVFQDDVTVERIREAVSCQCAGEALTVTVDTHMLQLMSVMSASLRDRRCRAEFNGTHFLLDFPLISCGTEGEMDGMNGRVRYTNTVFLWKPSEMYNETVEMNPVGVQISCEALVTSPASPVDVSPEEALRYRPELQRSQTPPLMFMELFVSDAYERRSVGPCVLTAHERLYVQISVVSGPGEAVELQSCWVSPLSDPQAHSEWYIIRQSCPHDPSLTLTDRQMPHRLHRGQAEPGNEDKTTQNDDRHDSLLSRWRGRRFIDVGRREGRRRRTRETRESEGENTHTLRFSFIFGPVFNNSIQFLHCSCEDRHLSRPVLVTSPVEFLAPPSGKRLQKPAEMSRQNPSQNDAEADTGAVLVVVFVGFVMGLGLMGALWCIYSHTGLFHLTVMFSEAMNEVEEKHQCQKPQNLVKLEISSSSLQKNTIFPPKRKKIREAGGHTCAQCGKCFKYKCLLQRHMRIHSEERPYTCPQCEKSFKRKSTLEKHIRIHTGVRQYTCPQCEKSFKRKSTLYEHMKIHSEERPYACPQCGKSFNRKSTLKDHVRIHTGERPYTCPQCEKSFTQKSTLDEHMKIHTGERPYTCPQCGKSFNRKSTLDDHVRNHTGVLPYACPQCGKSFYRKSTLEHHVGIHTGERP
ncbi:Transforming growth factor beta receptor type 3 [Triplophysa tibetana]|uniref:Transforming growth factor beta receptor type 3 n=1 Tax=Triplophysa tibetana TaxID=1572043 RepID=A0A5A9NBX8_9TELE|nr:Transforming growth factor beta receptor type 3 [Triplophysa tibetana]